VNLQNNAIQQNAQYTGYMESTTLMGTNVASNLMNQNTVVFGCTWSPWVNPMPYELQLGLTLFGIMFAVVFVAGLCCFFRKMDEDTVSKYLPDDIVDQDDNFQPFMLSHMQPDEYKQHMMQYSQRLDEQQIQQMYSPQYSAQYDQQSARYADQQSARYADQQSSRYTEGGQMSARVEV